MMGAVIGPDLVIGLGGFGETVPDALRDLAAMRTATPYVKTA